MSTIMHFDDKYTPETTVTSTVFDPNEQAGMLETYGEDFEAVVRINQSHPRKVWTVVDGDDDGLFACAGLHFCNRVYYLITKEEWTDPSEVLPFD